MTLDADDPNWPSLLSHPAEGGRDEMALERHLLGVAERARSVTPETRTTACGGDGGGERSLAEAAEIVGIAHDVGKASEWFQQYVGALSGTPDGPTHHSRLGAFAAYYALRERGFPPGTRFAGFVAVAKHHGDLPAATAFLERLDEDVQWTAGSAGYNYHAARQAQNIDDCDRTSGFAEAVFDELGDSGSWPDFRDRLIASTDLEPDRTPEVERTLRDLLVEEFYRVRDQHRTPCPEIPSAGTYLDELRLFGTLTFADKTHAAGIDGDDERLHAEALAPGDVTDHVANLGGSDDDLESSLNDLRSAIQDRIRGREGTDPVRQFVDGDRNVATLTLPTGYGKTLTGLLAAARIREMTGGERVVYALPFTSIVDQTAEVLEDVTGESELGRAFSVHHHLAETLTLENDGDATPNVADVTDERADEAVMLAESWRAGVTLTTFVQLFESLAGPRNGQSTKLPALHDSVVVVDEPQALPLRWWPLVRRMLRTLVSRFDATVLLMTATQPRLLEDPEPYELLPAEELTALEDEQFETVPERVEYRFDPTALSAGDGSDDLLGYEDAAGRLTDAAVETTDASLAICNTIDSTRKLFEEVTDAVEAATGNDPVDVAREYGGLLSGIGAPPATDESGDPSCHRRALVEHLVHEGGPDRPAVLHLTTRIRPCDRQFLIAIADDLAERNVPFVVVSTQLVEAGVDLSFDRVFRDFAPLDSIVQAAGRCNRSFERAPETGTVTVWRLESPPEIETAPSKAVYAGSGEETEFDLLDVTEKALGEHVDGERAGETTIARNAVATYHDYVGRAVRALSADNDLRKLFDRAAGDALRRESLIDRQLSYELYVCRTEADLQAARSVKSDLATGDYGAVKRTRDRLSGIRVSIPVYDPSSDVAGTLDRKLERFTDDETDPERILDATGDERKFDASLGVRPLESGVEDRFI